MCDSTEIVRKGVDTSVGTTFFCFLPSAPRIIASSAHPVGAGKKKKIILVPTRCVIGHPPAAINFVTSASPPLRTHRCDLRRQRYILLMTRSVLKTFYIMWDVLWCYLCSSPRPGTYTVETTNNDRVVKRSRSSGGDSCLQLTTTPDV